MFHRSAPFSLLPPVTGGEDLLQIPILLVALSIGAVLGGILVRLGSRVALGFTPPFGMAWTASFCGLLAAFLIDLAAIAFLDGPAGEMDAGGGRLVVVPVTLLVIGWLYGVILRRPQVVSNSEDPAPVPQQTVGFAAGLLVELVQVVAVVLIACIPVLLSKVL